MSSNQKGPDEEEPKPPKQRRKNENFADASAWKLTKEELNALRKMKQL
jgi:hypothetical protein